MGQKDKKELEEEIYDYLEKAHEQRALAPARFLAAWKEGVKLVGAEFFNVKSTTVDAATDKWQLTPNLEFIQKAAGGYSHGKQVLLALMYSFYDPEEGQKLLARFGTPNFVDAHVVLNLKGTQIIAELWLNIWGGNRIKLKNKSLYNE